MNKVVDPEQRRQVLEEANMYKPSILLHPGPVVLIRSLRIYGPRFIRRLSPVNINDLFLSLEKDHLGKRVQIPGTRTVAFLKHLPQDVPVSDDGLVGGLVEQNLYRDKFYSRDQSMKRLIPSTIKKIVFTVRSYFDDEYTAVVSELLVSNSPPSSESPSNEEKSIMGNLTESVD